MQGAAALSRRIRSLIEQQLELLEKDEKLAMVQPQDRTALLGELMKLFTPLAGMLGLGGRYLVDTKRTGDFGDDGKDAGEILGLGG